MMLKIAKEKTMIKSDEYMQFYTVQVRNFINISDGQKLTKELLNNSLTGYFSQTAGLTKLKQLKAQFLHVPTLKTVNN